MLTRRYTRGIIFRVLYNFSLVCVTLLNSLKTCFSRQVKTKFPSSIIKDCLSRCCRWISISLIIQYSPAGYLSWKEFLKLSSLVMIRKKSFILVFPRFQKINQQKKKKKSFERQTSEKEIIILQLVHHACTCHL